MFAAVHILNLRVPSCIDEKLWGSLLVNSAEDGNLTTFIEVFGNGILMVEDYLAVHNRGEAQDLYVHAGRILIVMFEVVVVQKILKSNKNC